MSENAIPPCLPVRQASTGFTARRGVHGSMALYKLCIIIIIIITDVLLGF